MKVLLCRADSSGCAYYRVTEPARAVAQLGLAEVRVDNGLDVQATVRDGETYVHHVNVRDADVVVFQRPTRKSLLPAMRRLQEQGVAVVVEIDDLLHHVDVMNMAHGRLNPRDNPGANYDNVVRAARLADWVTVSTPSLLSEYARHGRGSVVRNAIPRHVAELTPAYELRPEPARVTIGWTGSVGTHPWDLQEIGWGLRSALDSLSDRADFTIIGQSAGARERLNLDHDPTQVDWLASVDDYLQAIGDVLDVGLAPLREDRFNRSKSWLKPLEYAARGVASVHSKMPEYQALGVGRSASRPRDWQRHVERFVWDHSYRVEMARVWHEKVLAEHLTEHTAADWVDAWRRAVDVRRHR